ncbi:MAG TPA: GntR family transcriptional regulator [Conexibacter sp.]|nr:GntR family transcriptional regulator [Conexibacter sp.]
MTTLRKVVRSSLADDAHASIRNAIVRGAFPPGQQLVETRIAEEVGVGRGTAREALRRLRDEGLVVGSPNRGVFVRKLDLKDIVDMYNLRTGVEGVAIRLCARAGAPTDGLWKSVEEMRARAERNDIAGLSDREVSFHEELCRQSGNDYIVAAFRAVSGAVRLTFASEYASYADPLEVAAEHVPLIEAIEAGDEEHAVATLVAHLDIVKSIEHARLQLGTPADGSRGRLVSRAGIAGWESAGS